MPVIDISIAIFLSIAFKFPANLIELQQKETLIWFMHLDNYNITQLNLKPLESMYLKLFPTSSAALIDKWIKISGQDSGSVFPENTPEVLG